VGLVAGTGRADRIDEQHSDAAVVACGASGRHSVPGTPSASRTGASSVAVFVALVVPSASIDAQDADAEFTPRIVATEMDGILTMEHQQKAAEKSGGGKSSKTADSGDNRTQELQRRGATKHTKMVL